MSLILISCKKDNNEENNQIGDDCSCVSESNHVGKVSEEECHSTEKQCSSFISQITQQQTIPVLRTQHTHHSTIILLSIQHNHFNFMENNQTPFVIEGIDGCSVSHSSQTNITSFSSTDKFDSISSFTHSNCVDFKSFYKWLDQDNLFPQSLRRNDFHSLHNHPSISFIHLLHLQLAKQTTTRRKHKTHSTSSFKPSS